MPRWCFPARRLVLLLLVAVLSWGCQRSIPAPHSEKPGVRLAVLVVFDQMRGDYLERWKDLFGEGGFHRLETEGAWFTHCNYPYSGTFTGPGHASLATGCSPRVHGIIENDWFDRAAGERVYCAKLERYQRVPPLSADVKLQPLKPQDRGDGGPDRLLAPTLGDSLKEATTGEGRVVSLSLKDRSAVLLGGQQPDACYWFDPRTGTFVTSTCYRDHLPSWVARWNRNGVTNQWFGQSWERLRPDLDYERYSGPDDVVGEDKGYEQGRTFPHPFGRSEAVPGKAYYQALSNSPFGNEVLLSLARRAIDSEHLGSRQTADLLCLSFSSNDMIGHSWGPDSQEVFDVTLRSDGIVRQLLAHLDERVGRGHYFLVLTADHGVCPLAEVSRKQGRDAGVIGSEHLREQADDFLRTTFAKGSEDKTRWVLELTDLSFYLNHAAIRAHDLQIEKVADALAGWLKKQSGVLTTYTATELRKGVPADDAIGQKVLRSFYPDRSGDVMVILKPYWLTWGWKGTSHGSPHPYDSHVPLLVFGPGVRAGTHAEAVSPLCTVAILAHGLGIKPPAKAEAAVPENLFAE
jgi:hypothetical protein